jgi:hypothetical protein
VTLDEWGGCLEYKYELNDTQLPEEVIRRWRRYGVTSTFYDGLAKEGSGFIREFMRRVSGWRLKNNRYEVPIEHKLFHTYVKMTGQRTTADVMKLDQTSGVTPHAPA